MTIRLVDLLPEIPFPLFAMHPSRWRGESFIGDVTRENGQVSAVTFVYLTGVGPKGSGVAVSNVDPTTIRQDGWPDGHFTDMHLLNFAARFDPAFVRKHLKSRKGEVFPLKDFRDQKMVLPIGGIAAGSVWLQHATLPLGLVRTAMRRGDRVIELGIATWNEDGRAMAKQVEQIDKRFVQEFDAAVDAVYPPPEWSEPGPTS